MSDTITDEELRDIEDDLSGLLRMFNLRNEDERTPLEEFRRILAALRAERAKRDIEVKTKAAWESLLSERNRLLRDAEDKIDRVLRLLERNGCDCDCGHDAESHDDECERCFACQVNGAVWP